MHLRYRELLKHSAIYGLGQVIARLASVLMLPVHTRYLSPADYGIMAILDLSSTLLGILIAGGMSPAMTRFHQDATSPTDEDAVWWTSFAVTLGMTAAIVVPMIAFYPQVAGWLVGTSDSRGPLLILLSAAALFFAVVTQLTTVYFRLRMWSWLTMQVALLSLLFNMALNIYLLVGKGMGLTGVLVGNLVTNVLFTVVRMVIVWRACGRFRFNRPLAAGLLRFGTPVVVTLLMATVMHQADRYLLERYVDLDSVGVYSLAYQIGQGLSVLLLVPFGSVWSVSMYDIAKEPDSKEAFARVFEYFVYAVLLLMLGASLFIEPALRVFATSAYSASAALVPVICLAVVFFSLESHFRVPALLAKQTMSLVPATVVGAVVNIGLNLLLIPAFGVVAAAWVSVATYFVYVAVLYLQARRIEHYDYPLFRCAATLIGMIATFALYRSLVDASNSLAWTLGWPTLIWCSWAGFLALPVVKSFRRRSELAAVEA